MNSSKRLRIEISQPSVGEEEWKALKGPLDSGWLTQGPMVAEFEKEFAKHHGVEYAVATTSCTTALHLILTALNVGPGDEVVVPAFTWVATANVVKYCGAKPVFIDIERETFNIDPAAIADKITEKTKAVIPVHLFGLCADVEAVAKAAPGVPLVCDAACAVGAKYKQASAGVLGAASAFSFHPRKSITTGEGGMITTNDASLAENMIKLRNHGAAISEEQRHVGPKPYILPEFNLLGYNYRMTDLQGAVGLVQLSKLDRFTSERERWARYYSRELAAVEWLKTPTVPEGFVHGWQSYVCLVVERKAPIPRNTFMNYLLAQGISTRPGTHALHMLGLYRSEFGFDQDDFPAARDCDRYSIALPLHNRMKPDDYEYIVETIRSI
jgi:dTDP-4-amino-4,6-dideoxygalactose transaminase